MIPPRSPSSSPVRSRTSGNLRHRYQEELVPKPVHSVSLTEWEEQHAREIFDAYDYDNSSTINRTELQEMLMEQQWCVDARALDDFIQKYVGEEAEVEYESFLRVYGAMLAKQPSTVRRKREKGDIGVEDMYELESSTREVFEAINVDRTGYLNEDEMREAMRQAGLPDADGDGYESVVVEYMRLYDQNQDGKISFEEFILYRNAVLDNFYTQAQAQDSQKFANGMADPDMDPWAECLFAS